METLDTKALITDTFKELLHHKNVDKISVKDIVMACNISRQTFYYHFQDILDVVEWSLRLKMDNAVKCASSTDNPKEAILVFVMEMKENRELIHKLEDSQRCKQLEQMMVDGVYSCIKVLLLKRTNDLNISHMELETALSFYSNGFMHFMLTKCEDNNFNEQKLADQIYRICFGHLKIFVDEEE